MDVNKLFSRASVNILLCFILAILCQSIILLTIKDNPNNFFQNHIVPLWTNDSGLYGFYANKLLQGANPPFNSEYMPGYLLYFLAKTTPFSIDTLLYVLPVIVSSLIVIPIILIGRLVDLRGVGFFAGLISTLAYGYYFRSFYGYYDTDMLNLFFPLMIVYGFMGLGIKQNKFYLLVSSLSLLCFSLWYHSFIAIGGALVGIWTLYALIFRNDKLDSYLLILMLCASFLHLAIWVKLLIILVIFAISFLKISINRWYFIGVFLLVCVIGAFFVDISFIYERAMDYIFKSNYIDSKYKFANALKTISEAKSTSFISWSNKITYNQYFVPFAAIGYLLLIVKNRAFLLFLPLIALGLIAMVAGNRFILFGVPVMSLGLIYMIYTVSEFADKYRNITFLVISSIVCIFYVERMMDFTRSAKPIFKKSDLEVLDKMPKNKNNFILTWWDYGWPLWYETGAKTLIDNGKHFEDNYIISKLYFDANQTYVANASKQVVKLFGEAKKHGYPKLVPYIFSKQKPEIAIKSLGLPSDLKTPVYWYFNIHLLKIAKNMKTFSNINFKTGKKLHYFKKLYVPKSGAKFDKKKGVFYRRKGVYAVKLHVKNGVKTVYNKNAKFYLIETKSHYLLCSKNIYDSFLVQAMLLNNIDKNLFEIISRSNTSLLLKVK